MYAYLKGKVTARTQDGLVLENGGIGYRIQAAAELLPRFPAPGEEALIHTWLYVREDQIAIFGFMSLEELNMFELLLTVSGIGPRVAGSIVGTFTPGQLAMAILAGDTKTLTQVRGIGRKSAERLILELKDKLKGVELPEEFSQETAAVTAESSAQAEAASALVVLGYSSTEAARAVAAVGREAEQTEEIIRLALRQLMR